MRLNGSLQLERQAEPVLIQVMESSSYIKRQKSLRFSQRTRKTVRIIETLEYYRGSNFGESTALINENTVRKPWTKDTKSLVSGELKTNNP